MKKTTTTSTNVLPFDTLENSVPTMRKQSTSVVLPTTKILIAILVACIGVYIGMYIGEHITITEHQFLTGDIWRIVSWDNVEVYAQQIRGNWIEQAINLFVQCVQSFVQWLTNIF